MPIADMQIIRVPYELPSSTDVDERAKEASGLRLNGTTQCEISNLRRLAAAGCTATPKLLAVKIDLQE